MLLGWMGCTHTWRRVLDASSCVCWQAAVCNCLRWGCNRTCVDTCSSGRRSSHTQSGTAPTRRRVPGTLHDCYGLDNCWRNGTIVEKIQEDVGCMQLVQHVAQTTLYTIRISLARSYVPLHKRRCPRHTDYPSLGTQLPRAGLRRLRASLRTSSTVYTPCIDARLIAQPHDRLQLHVE